MSAEDRRRAMDALAAAYDFGPVAPTAPRPAPILVPGYDAPHGTMTGYKNGCRLWCCRAARRAYYAANKAAYLAQNAKRRARLRGAEHSPWTHDGIFQRDRLRGCYLCGLGFGDLDVYSSAVVHIDHVLPLSRGGADTPDNLAAVHAACNLRKGARVDEQPVPNSQTSPIPKPPRN